MASQDRPDFGGPGSTDWTVQALVRGTSSAGRPTTAMEQVLHLTCSPQAGAGPLKSTIWESPWHLFVVVFVMPVPLCRVKDHQGSQAFPPSALD